MEEIFADDDSDGEDLLLGDEWESDSESEDEVCEQPVPAPVFLLVLPWLQSIFKRFHSHSPDGAARGYATHNVVTRCLTTLLATCA